MKFFNPIFLCLCLSTILSAQDDFIIQIDYETYICGSGCLPLIVDEPPAAANAYHWTATLEGVSYTANTVEPYWNWCDIPNVGSADISLDVYGLEGNIIASSSTSLPINSIILEASHYAIGTVTNACQVDSFYYHSDIVENTTCYDVCLGSTSSINLSQLTTTADPFYNIVHSYLDQWSIEGGQIPEEEEVFNAPTIVIEEVPYNWGAYTCIPVKVYNFNNVSSFEFNMNIESIISNFSINSIAPIAGFIYPLNFDFSNFYLNPTALGVAWSHPQEGASIELEDGSVLFEICGNLSLMQAPPPAFYYENISVTLSDAMIGINDVELSPALEHGAIVFNPYGLLDIEWTEEGTHTISNIGAYPHSIGCTYPYEVSFCFNVIAPPAATIISQPATNADGILEVCEGQSIYFSNESENVNSYTWDFGDGSYADSQNPVHAYSVGGTYEVSLITDAGCACADTTSMLVIVEGNEAPFVDCVATICEGTTVTYTATSSCATYAWEISNNGSIVDGGGSQDDFITIAWGSGPIGEISLATDGCPDLSNCTTAAYMQVPIVSASANISGPNEVCKGARAEYSLPAFEGTDYYWDVSSFGTIIAGQGTPSITVEWFDEFIVSEPQEVSVIYNNCYLDCGGSASLEVVMLPAFYAMGDVEVCALGTSSYNVVNTQTGLGFDALFEVIDAAGNVVWNSPTASASVLIDWDFGIGTYRLNIRPSDPAAFCKDSYEMQIDVVAQPSPPTAIIGQNEICPNIYYTYEVDNPIDGESYQWTITNGANTSEQEGRAINVSWGMSPPYILSVKRLSPPLYCSSAAITLNVSGIDSFSILGDSLLCQNSTSTYTSTQTGDVHYAWSVLPANAASIISGANAASVELLWHQAGQASLVLDICGQISTKNIEVQALPQADLNYSPNICPATTTTVSTDQTYSTYSWQNEADQELSAAPNIELGAGYYQLIVSDTLACVGSSSFSINEYAASTISISTPDYNIFCQEDPLTTLHAVNAHDSYSYQWYRNDTIIPAATNTQYTATSFADYHVDIIDENGCSFSSNTIRVYEDCDDTRCMGGNSQQVPCINPDQHFLLLDGSSCNDRSYQAELGVFNASSLVWDFDDPSSFTNIAVGPMVSHTYNNAGFYRVLLQGFYQNAAGGFFICDTIQNDTILAVADFDFEASCVGAPMQFYDTSTFLDDFTDIVSWTWDFGDPTSPQNTSTNKDPTHIFANAGSYNVSLSITTSTGCNTSISKSVIVHPLPFVSFATPDFSCASSLVSFEADVEANVNEVQWTYGDPSSGQADTSALFNSIHLYDSPATYNVELKGTNIYGCSNSYNQNISITPNNLNATIAPMANNTICEGDQLTLSALSPTATQWRWSNGAQTASIEVNSAASYTLTVTDNEGCTYTPAEAVVNVITPPQSPIYAASYNSFGQIDSYTYDTLFICEGEEVFLATEQEAGLSYSWSTGQNDNAIEFSLDRANLLDTGTHQIELMLTDSSSMCSALETFVVVVHPKPETPQLLADSVLCGGTEHSISIANIDTGLNYYWNNGQQGSSITTDIAKDYNVLAINEYGCQSKSEVVSILQGPDVSLVPNGCHIRCLPDTLCIPPIDNIVSFQWYQDGAAIPAPVGTVYELIIEEAGVYTLEMEDVNGCIQESKPLAIEAELGYGDFVGNIYFDTNDNEIIDQNDELASDIGITLANNNLSSIEQMTTNATGSYTFMNMPEDTYSLAVNTLSIPTDWMLSQATIDTSFSGCDKIIEYDWLLKPVCPDSTFTTAVCENESFVFYGQHYAIGNDYTAVVSGLGSCDTTFHFSVSALATSNEALAVAVCPDESYTYNGQSYPVGTNEAIHFTNSLGCDSTVQLTVTALATSNETLAVQVCPDESYTYNGENYPVGTNEAIHFTNSLGCDSTVQLIVTALTISNETLAVQVCPDESYTYNGENYPVGTNEAIHFTNSLGCDSTVQLIVTALTTSNETLAVQVCPDESYTYNGENYPVGTHEAIHFTNSLGCDSTVQLIVTALTTSSEMLAVEVCPNESYNYNGIDYPIGSNETIHFTNSMGCDSIIELVVYSSELADIDIETTTSCTDEATGQLEITNTSGALPLSYSIDGINFQTTTVFEQLAASSYTLTYQDANNCMFEQLIDIPPTAPLLVDIATEVALPCYEEGISISPYILSGDDGQLSFEWSDGVLTQERILENLGLINLNVSNACEQQNFSIRIHPETIANEDLIYFPNVFSPNGDGANDHFMPISTADVSIEIIRFQVFDRWGALFFDAQNSHDQWDGHTRGQAAANGVYVWQIEAIINYCGQTIDYKKSGDVLLIR